jgi:23S rRNA (adenine2030-N6)-methyltransferase
LYDHRHHAGNAGDVWKHVALLALLAANKRERVTVVDTHAGAGVYRIGGGEAQQGVARLPTEPATGSGAVDRYVARVQRADRGTYPGSPVLALGALGRNDRLVCHERDPEAAAALKAALGGDPRARVSTEDGWAASALASDERLLVHIDPPYAEKADWDRAAELVPRLARHQVLLWYPIKRWSRPNQLLQRIRETGVPFVALDLVWTPLELEKDRMVGSGLVLVGAPRSVLVELHGAAPVLGPLLATHDGRWTLRATAAG